MISCRNRSVQNRHNLCSQCAPCSNTGTQALRALDDDVVATGCSSINDRLVKLHPLVFWVHVDNSCQLFWGQTISYCKFNKLHVSGTLSNWL